MLHSLRHYDGNTATVFDGILLRVLYYNLSRIQILRYYTVSAAKLPSYLVHRRY